MVRPKKWTHFVTFVWHWNNIKQTKLWSPKRRHNPMTIPMVIPLQLNKLKHFKIKQQMNKWLEYESKEEIVLWLKNVHTCSQRHGRCGIKIHDSEKEEMLHFLERILRFRFRGLSQLVGTRKSKAKRLEAHNKVDIPSLKFPTANVPRNKTLK